MQETQSKLDGPKPPQPNGKEADAPTVARYYVLLFQSVEDIDRATVRDIQRQLDAFVTTPAEQTEIDVWVESFGGDAHAAYKLAIDLRSRCRRLRAVVPDIAKSAATLLMLGMDEIYMAAAAELGPLDLQIEHPDREDVTVSALDVSNAVEFLGQTAFGMVITGGAGVVQFTGLRRNDVLNATFPFVAEFLKPIVAKVDPHILHQATTHLRVAERYARDLIARRPEGADKERCLGIVDHLIHHYPAHEFVIARREAREMGLPIKNLEDYDQIEMLKCLYEPWEEEADGDSFVLVLDNEALEKLKVSKKGTKKESDHETDNEVTKKAGKEATQKGHAALSASSGQTV